MRMRYVLLLFITAVTMSCSIEEWNSPQSIGYQDLQQIKRDLPSRICAYSPTKFWGENLPMKSSETDIYIGSEELDYELSMVYFNECYKYIQIPINQSGLLDSSIVRFNHIEVGNSPLSAPSKPKTFLIAQYPLDNDTVSPIFNIVTIIPQPKYMSDENIMALDFFNKVELKLNGVVLYSTLSGDFQRVDVLINGDMYFRGRLGNDGEYAENEIYTKLLFPSDMNIAQFGGGDEGGDGGDGEGGDDNGDGSDDPDWIDEAVVVADNPNNTGYIIDDPGINYPGPEIPGGGTNPPPVGGGGGNSFQLELIITVEGEGVVTGAGFYYKGEDVTCTASPKLIGKTAVSEFVHWGGFYESTESTISFTLPEYTFNTSVQLTAVFHNLTPCNDGVFFDPLLDMKICGTPANPVQGGRYGNTRESGTLWHGGLDLLCEEGTPVFSCTDGVVARTFSSFTGDYNLQNYISETGDKDGWANGNCIFIETYINGKLQTFCYLHLTDVYVSVGDSVTPGQIIGTSGITGNYSVEESGGKHLHLQIKDGPHYISAKDNSLDPELFIYTKFDEEGNAINHCK